MAEQDLGLAVLRLTVDSGAAIQALNEFRQKVNSSLSGAGSGVFDGITKDAQNAGEKAGKNLADGIKKATTGLKFESIKEALDFSGALDGTLRDLREYEKALVALREATRATAPDFGVLNDVIAATSQTIKNYASSTDQLVDAAARVALKEEAERLRERLQEVRANAQQDREWAGAIRAIEGAQRSAARATDEANRAYRAQLDLVAGIAKKGVRDVGGAIGAVGRGVGAAARTAVNVGRTGYSVGAELGIFEEPKSGPLKQSIQQVIDRFKFLGEQAKTTRGIVLRTLEGVGAGAGLLELAKNANLLREALNALGITAKATDATVSGFAKFGDYFANSGLGSVGPLKDLFQGIAEVEKGTSAITSFTDQLLQLGIKGGTSGLDAIEALVNGFTSLPPAAQAAALAAPAVFAALSGPVSKRAQEDLEKVRTLLEGIGTTSLQVTDEAQALLEELARASMSIGELTKARNEALAQRSQAPVGTEDNLTATKEILDLDKQIAAEKDKQFYLEQSLLRTSQERLQISEALKRAAGSANNPQLALPSSEMLNAEGRGINRLSTTGINDTAFDAGIAKGREFTQQLLAAAGAGGQLPPIFRQVLSSLESLASITNEQTVGLRAQNELLQDQLNLTQQLEGKRSQQARQRLAQQAQERLQTKADLIAQEAESRKQQRVAAERTRSQRAQRIGGAVGSGIIGGAFPALFGQGLGASVGGGLGGVAGGVIGGQFGFGLSLVGTALGAQFDEALRKGQLLAAGLDDPIGKFQELKTAALLSSAGLEKQAEALINSGRGAEAAALIQEDLTKRFGDTSQLDGLRNAFDELGRAFSQLSVLTVKFVAGPLADFLNKLAASFTAQSNKQLFDERMRGLTAEQRRQVQGNVSNARAGLNDGSRTLAEAAVIYYQRQLDFIDRIAGRTKERATAERDLAAASARTSRLNQISLELITAEATGNKQRVTELKREQLGLQQLNKEKEAGAKAADATLKQIALERSQQDKQLTEQAASDDRKRWANSIASANRIRDIQGQIAIENKRSGLSDIGIGALRTIEQFRSAIRAEQNAQANARANPFDPEALNASREAAANTRLAAAKAKQDLLDAFKAAQDSVRSISRGIEDSTLQLLQLKGGNSGLNSFLSGQALYDNQQLAFQQLLPQFLRARELAARDAERFGNPNAAEQFRGLNFSGPVAGVNQRMADFIQAQRSQDRLQQDLYDSNVALVKANASLTEVAKALNDVTLNVYDNITNLTTSIDTLSSKDWRIQISVAADGSSSAYGDLVNQAVTQ